MKVSDNTIQTERFSSFLKNLGNISAKAGKKLATNVLKSPGRALDITATLLQQLQVEILKQLYQHYLNLLTFITPEKVFSLGNWW